MSGKGKRGSGWGKVEEGERGCCGWWLRRVKVVRG